MASNLGFFLGGAADAIQQAQQTDLQKADLGLRSRTLDLQTAQFANTLEQQQIAQVDKAIGDTMGTIKTTIDSLATNGSLDTSNMDSWKAAISSIESGGNYGETGPVTTAGDYAVGKYQVMASNVPVWTKEVLGTPLTPQQFAANPQAQEAVFAAKFGQYVQQTGSPERAALMWFTGRADNSALTATDQLGTSGADYLQRFNEVLSAQPKQKVQAVVTPLLNSITSLAAKAGRDPQTYIDQVNAMVASAPIGVDQALKAGQDNAKKIIGEYNGLIRAGVAQADAALTAGIKQAGGTLTADNIGTLESSLRSQYFTQTKDFTVVQNYYTAMQNATNTQAGDITRIFGFMKMLDPTSVVMQGEQATVANAPNVDSQLRTLYNQLLGNGTLTPERRQEVMAQATKFYAARQKQQQYVTDQFRQIATRTGLNPDNVVVDTSKVDQTAPGAPVAATGTTAPTGASAAPASTGTGIGSIPPGGYSDAGTPPQAFVDAAVAAGSTPDQAAYQWKFVPPDQRSLWQ